MDCFDSILKKAIALSKKAKENYIALYELHAYAFFLQAEKELSVNLEREKKAYFFSNRHQGWNLLENRAQILWGQNRIWIGSRPGIDWVLQPGLAYYSVQQSSTIVAAAREQGNLEMELKALRFHHLFSELYLTIEHGWNATLLRSQTKKGESPSERDR